MKCYKCHEELYPFSDTAWIKHKDGTKKRTTDLFCADCRIWVTIIVNDYSECINLDEEEE